MQRASGSVHSEAEQFLLPGLLGRVSFSKGSRGIMQAWRFDRGRKGGALLLWRNELSVCYILDRSTQQDSIWGEETEEKGSIRYDSVSCRSPGYSLYQDARVERIMEQDPPWCQEIEIVKAEDVLFQEQKAPGEHIKSLIDSIPDSTGREDLKMILIRETMLEKAMKEGWSYILMANTADARAREAVAATAKGQGLYYLHFRAQ
eukprot:jgi/Picre1/35319/NNA_002781.t1